MKLFQWIAAAALTTGTTSASIVDTPLAAGQPPACEVSADGHTHVYFNSAQHPSFKCSHLGATCTCTLKHPTHDKGGCKQLESKLAGKHLDVGGDCTDSGKNTPTLITGLSPDRATSSASWNGRGTYNFDGCVATYNVTPRDAFDGNFNTAWDGCCQHFPDRNGGHWLRYDLGEKKTIRAYGFSTGCGECPQDFIMLGSNDGNTWAELDRRTGQRCFHLKHSSYTIAAHKTGAYRYLKWTFQTVYGGNQNGVRISDVALLA